MNYESHESEMRRRIYVRPRGTGPDEFAWAPEKNRLPAPRVH